MSPLTVENPIYAAVQKWCDERNRKTRVALRLLLTGFFGAPIFVTPPLWSLACAVVAGALGCSFLRYPRWQLFKFASENSWEFVPDRLLQLMAESSEIDTDTKLLLADIAARSGGITHDQLAGVALRVCDKRMRAERSREAGYLALTSLVCPLEDETNSPAFRALTSSRGLSRERGL